VTVQSSNDSFWPAAVDLTFVNASGPAQLDAPTALQQPNVTRVIAHKEGSDGIIQVQITVGQLKDIEASVVGSTFLSGGDPFHPAGSAPNGVNTKNFQYGSFPNSSMNGSTPAFRIPVPAAFRLIKAPWHGSPTGTDMRDEASWDTRMACTRRNDGPVGRVYLAQRKNHPVQERGPKLIAIWRPRFVEFSPGQDFQGQGVHVFFHPFVDKKWHWSTRDFYDCARRYMFNQKGMVQQHYWTHRKVVFVMPVASDDGWMGDLTSWPGIDRFVREVLFFMLNLENAARTAMLLQFVDRVAVSGFSFGIRGATYVVAGAPETSRLREVYSFDGVESHGRAPAFNQALLGWLGRCARSRDPRYFRVYTQDASPNQEGLADAVGDTSNPKPVPQRVTVQEGWDTVAKDASGAPVLGPKDYSVTTQEWQGATRARTLLSMPTVAWQGLVSPLPPGRLNDDKTPMNDQMRFYGAAHQYAPEYFVYHAIDNSGFPK
jgi:hypothetical protein